MNDDEQSRVLAVHGDPALTSFGSGHHARLRLAIGEHGWCVGVVWVTQKHLGLPGSAGVTWSVLTKPMHDLWSYLRDCSARGIDGVFAYEAATADSREVTFSDEVIVTGAELEHARLWVLGLDDATGWAGALPLPERTRTRWLPRLALEQFVVVRSPTDTGKTWLCRLGLDGGRAQLLVRTDGQWVEVPASQHDAVADHTVVTEAYVELYDASPPDATTPPVVAAFSPTWQGNLWAGVPEEEWTSADLMIGSDSDDAPVGLFLSTDAHIYARGEGRWFRLPSNLTDHLTFVQVPRAAIALWDEHERLADARDSASMISVLRGEPDHWSQQPRLFEGGIPPEFGARAGEADVWLAPGPIVVEVGQQTMLGIDLSRRADLVRWTDRDGHCQVMDSGWVTLWWPDQDRVNLAHPVLGLHGLIRPLNLDDAAWVVPQGAAHPGSLERLLDAAMDPFLSSPAKQVAMPSDGSWLVVDTSTGYTFSQHAVMVPEPPRDAIDLLQSDEGEQGRASWAAEQGRRLLMPGSAGTPVDELTEWDEPPWFIDPVNGDATWSPWTLVLVPCPDAATVIYLTSDYGHALSYAAEHGQVPVAPYRWHVDGL